MDIQRMEEDPPALRSCSHSRSRKRQHSALHDQSDNSLYVNQGLQAEWTARDPLPEDFTGLWEKAKTRTQRRAQLKAQGQPQAPLNRKACATLGTHVIRFQPTERCDVSRLDPEDLLAAVSSFATDPELRKLQLLRVSTISNTITVTTCDSKQAAHLLRTTSLPLKTQHPLPVRAYQLPTEEISKGVIHGCKPNESPEKLLSALHGDGVDILSARPMGSRGTTLIIFASPRPPSEVTYWHFHRRVERYQQRSLVCQRWHKPGPRQPSAQLKSPSVPTAESNTIKAQSSAPTLTTNSACVATTLAM
ncbi:hypothetical protein IscW_ISCW013588 [Ixodes scapularis]|uniref:Uncharacterized protein n=1 Tax=Ixodes scapularis TaxID=6945 RepID=B7QGN9_IXOSC|nr:hypothetical protein IscW_ISCW013588 [Ixodes scapularis]|eukprot:XP_002400217.1 hypothetical protein IscW_ISCW013588 [Ixodes scapularis]